MGGWVQQELSRITNGSTRVSVQKPAILTGVHTLRIRCTQTPLANVRCFDQQATRVRETQRSTIYAPSSTPNVPQQPALSNEAPREASEPSDNFGLDRRALVMSVNHCSARAGT